MKIRHLAIVAAAFIVTAVATPALAVYHPGMGRFLQRDPHGTMIVPTAPRVGMAGPAAAGGFVARDPMPTRPQPSLQYADGMNLYQYVRSRPTMGRDPSGLFSDGIPDSFHYPPDPDDNPPAWGSDCRNCNLNCAIYPPGANRTRCLELCDERCEKAYVDPSTVTPLPASSPECDKYSCNDTYSGAYARCFCKCAGDSQWSKFVRGCLRKLYDQGVSPDMAHRTCYALADDQNFPGGRPWSHLAWCYAKCKDLNPFK